MLFTAPASADHNVGVVIVYSMNYSYPGDDTRKVRELLLGSPAEYYKLYEDHLPRRLPYAFVKGMKELQPDVRPAEEIPGLIDYDVGASLFALPSNQVVLAVSFEFTCDIGQPQAIVDLLEQTIDGNLIVKNQTLAAFVQDLRDEVPGLRTDSVGTSYRETWSMRGQPPVILLPERHQVVFLRDTGDVHVPSADAVHRIVYRPRPPYSEEFARPKEPEQLNRYRLPSDGARGDGISWRQLLRRDSADPDGDKIRETIGVVTPYTSLLYGHKDYVESSVLLSTVHAVGTASRFRQIWHDTFVQVRRFRETKQEATAGRQTRASLEDLADHLGNLEFDLTFSVEFPLMRAMRIESFQNALYEAMDLSTQAERLSQMFSQVSSSVRSEITAINVREHRTAEDKRKWNAFAATVLSLLGVSVGFIIAFLGINTSEVLGATPDVSMWDGRFATLYFIAGLFALTPAYFICLPYLRGWIRLRRRSGMLAATVGPLIAAAGVGLILLADDLSRLGSAADIAINGILKALGFFGITMGLSLVGFGLASGRHRRST